MDANRRGLTSPLLAKALKKYSGHRRIAVGVTAALLKKIIKKN